MTSNTALTAALVTNMIYAIGNISLGLRGQRVHGGVPCKHRDVCRWAGSAVDRWWASSQGKKKHSKVFLPNRTRG